MADVQVTFEDAEDGSARSAAPRMGDKFPYQLRGSLLSVRKGDDPQALKLDWSDGSVSEWHSIALREMCPCTSCRHPESYERIFDQLSYDLNIHPQSISVDGGLTIEWSDGHISRYDAAWLQAGGRYERVVPPLARVEWSRSFEIPRFDYSSIAQSDKGMMDWLVALVETGLVYVEGAPQEPGVVEQVLSKVAHLRDTNFGLIFDVESVAGAISNAYTAKALPLHVDLPNREYQPGFQFLHCIRNDASGGQSTYCDGFAVASALKSEHPEAYEILTNTLIRYRYHDEHEDLVRMTPLIVTDTSGTVVEVRVNPSLMSGIDASVSDTKAFYRAYRLFLSLTRSPDFMVTIQMQAGEIACFDNRRVMHGRTEFDPESGGRKLQGAYLEREDILSRIATLQRGYF